MLISVSALECRLTATKVLSLPDGFALRRGQHWCIAGGNGAGKTALVQLLLGRLPQARNAVHYAEGFDPASDVCEVSFEEQQRLCALDNRFDISEFTASAVDTGTSVESLILHGSCDCADNKRLESILTLLDIAHIRLQGIRYLSSGQMRRALIARALYRRPVLLVLDDPLESIDRHSAELIQTALTNWIADDNATLFMCRRRQQTLRGMTHALLMEDLGLHEQGNFQDVWPTITRRLWRRLPIQMPAQLPARCAGRSPAPVPEHAALISLQGVSAAYGDHLVFRDLYFEMRQGDHVLLEGPNGCGKSTLLGLIDGDNHKAYGQPVYLFGQRRGSGESVWQIKSRFGVVSNDLHNRYIKGWRVTEVVVSGFFDSLGLYDDCGASEVMCARAWLSVLGLGDVARDYYHELSFGQQRLVLLARAMVKHPLILVLDEPCVGLDDYHSEFLLAMVDFIASTGNTQILFVSHSADETPSCINTRLVFTLNRKGANASSAASAGMPHASVAITRQV